MVIVDHIIKEGARFHVLYWDNLGEHCSEENCIINYPNNKIGDLINKGNGYNKEANNGR